MIQVCALADLPPSFFDLRTGKPKAPPAKRPIRTYPVAVEDGVIYLDAPARAEVTSASVAAEPSNSQAGHGVT